MSKNDYIHIPKWWILRQIEWNKRITDWLFMVLPRDPRGDIIPSMDSPDYLKYADGVKQTAYLEDFLVKNIKQEDRRSDDGEQLFEDVDRRA